MPPKAGAAQGRAAAAGQARKRDVEGDAVHPQQRRPLQAANAKQPPPWRWTASSAAKAVPATAAGRSTANVAKGKASKENLEGVLSSPAASAGVKGKGSDGPCRVAVPVDSCKTEALAPARPVSTAHRGMQQPSPTADNEALNFGTPCCFSPAPLPVQKLVTPDMRRLTLASPLGAVTPPECQAMLLAVEDAINHVSCNNYEGFGPGSSHKVQLQKTTEATDDFVTWLSHAGMQSVPASLHTHLKVLYDQANESCGLKAALSAMRQSELDLAAQDAEDNARHLELLADENEQLLEYNAQLQQQLLHMREQLLAVKPLEVEPSSDRSEQPSPSQHLTAQSCGGEGPDPSTAGPMPEPQHSGSDDESAAMGSVLEPGTSCGLSLLSSSPAHMQFSSWMQQGVGDAQQGSNAAPGAEAQSAAAPTPSELSLVSRSPPRVAFAAWLGASAGQSEHGHRQTGTSQRSVAGSPSLASSTPDVSGLRGLEADAGDERLLESSLSDFGAAPELACEASEGSCNEHSPVAASSGRDTPAHEQTPTAIASPCEASEGASQLSLISHTPARLPYPAWVLATGIKGSEQRSDDQRSQTCTPGTTTPHLSGEQPWPDSAGGAPATPSEVTAGLSELSLVSQSPLRVQFADWRTDLKPHQQPSGRAASETSDAAVAVATISPAGSEASIRNQQDDTPVPLQQDKAEMVATAGMGCVALGSPSALTFGSSLPTSPEPSFAPGCHTDAEQTLSGQGAMGAEWTAKAAPQEGLAPSSDKEDGQAFVGQLSGWQAQDQQAAAGLTAWLSQVPDASPGSYTQQTPACSIASFCPMTAATITDDEDADTGTPDSIQQPLLADADYAMRPLSPLSPLRLLQPLPLAVEDVDECSTLPATLETFGSGSEPAHSRPLAATAVLVAADPGSNAVPTSSQEAALQQSQPSMSMAEQVAMAATHADSPVLAPSALIAEEHVGDGAVCSPDQFTFCGMGSHRSGAPLLQQSQPGQGLPHSAAARTPVGAAYAMASPMAVDTPVPVWAPADMHGKPPLPAGVGCGPAHAGAVQPLSTTPLLSPMSIDSEPLTVAKGQAPALPHQVASLPPPRVHAPQQPSHVMGGKAHQPVPQMPKPTGQVAALHGVRQSAHAGAPRETVLAGAQRAVLAASKPGMAVPQPLLKAAAQLAPMAAAASERLAAQAQPASRKAQTPEPLPMLSPMDWSPLPAHLHGQQAQQGVKLVAAAPGATWAMPAAAMPLKNAAAHVPMAQSVHIAKATAGVPPSAAVPPAPSQPAQAFVFQATAATAAPTITMQVAATAVGPVAPLAAVATAAAAPAQVACAPTHATGQHSGMPAAVPVAVSGQPQPAAPWAATVLPAVAAPTDVHGLHQLTALQLRQPDPDMHNALAQPLAPLQPIAALMPVLESEPAALGQSAAAEPDASPSSVCSADTMAPAGRTPLHTLEVVVAPVAGASAEPINRQLLFGSPAVLPLLPMAGQDVHLALALEHSAAGPDDAGDDDDEAEAEVSGLLPSPHSFPAGQAPADQETATPQPWPFCTPASDGVTQQTGASIGAYEASYTPISQSAEYGASCPEEHQRLASPPAPAPSPEPPQAEHPQLCASPPAGLSNSFMHQPVMQDICTIVSPEALSLQPHLPAPSVLSPLRAAPQLPLAASPAPASPESAALWPPASLSPHSSGIRSKQSPKTSATARNLFWGMPLSDSPLSALHPPTDAGLSSDAGLTATLGPVSGLTCGQEANADAECQAMGSGSYCQTEAAEDRGLQAAVDASSWVAAATAEEPEAGDATAFEALGNAPGGSPEHVQQGDAGQGDEQQGAVDWYDWEQSAYLESAEPPASVGAPTADLAQVQAPEEPKRINIPVQVMTPGWSPAAQMPATPLTAFSGCGGAGHDQGQARRSGRVVQGRSDEPWHTAGSNSPQESCGENATPLPAALLQQCWPDALDRALSPVQGSNDAGWIVPEGAVEGGMGADVEDEVRGAAMSLQQVFGSPVMGPSAATEQQVQTCDGHASSTADHEQPAGGDADACAGQQLRYGVSSGQAGAEFEGEQATESCMPANSGSGLGSGIGWQAMPAPTLSASMAAAGTTAAAQSPMGSAATPTREPYPAQIPDEEATPGTVGSDDAEGSVSTSTSAIWQLLQSAVQPGQPLQSVATTPGSPQHAIHQAWGRHRAAPEPSPLAASVGSMPGCGLGAWLEPACSYSASLPGCRDRVEDQDPGCTSIGQGTTVTASEDKDQHATPAGCPGTPEHSVAGSFGSWAAPAASVEPKLRAAEHQAALASPALTPLSTCTASLRAETPEQADQDADAIAVPCLELNGSSTPVPSPGPLGAAPALTPCFPGLSGYMTPALSSASGLQQPTTTENGSIASESFYTALAGSTSTALPMQQGLTPDSAVAAGPWRAAADATPTSADPAQEAGAEEPAWTGGVNVSHPHSTLLVKAADPESWSSAMGKGADAVPSGRAEVTDGRGTLPGPDQEQLAMALAEGVGGVAMEAAPCVAASEQGSMPEPKAQENTGAPSAAMLASPASFKHDCAQTVPSLSPSLLASAGCASTPLSTLLDGAGQATGPTPVPAAAESSPAHSTHAPARSFAGPCVSHSGLPASPAAAAAAVTDQVQPLSASKSAPALSLSVPCPSVLTSPGQTSLQQQYTPQQSEGAQDANASPGMAAAPPMLDSNSPAWAWAVPVPRDFATPSSSSQFLSPLPSGLGVYGQLTPSSAGFAGWPGELPRGIYLNGLAFLTPLMDDATLQPTGDTPGTAPAQGLIPMGQHALAQTPGSTPACDMRLEWGDQCVTALPCSPLPCTAAPVSGTSPVQPAAMECGSVDLSGGHGLGPAMAAVGSASPVTAMHLEAMCVPDQRTDDHDSIDLLLSQLIQGIAADMEARVERSEGAGVQEAGALVEGANLHCHEDTHVQVDGDVPAAVVEEVLQMAVAAGFHELVLAEGEQCEEMAGTEGQAVSEGAACAPAEENEMPAEARGQAVLGMVEELPWVGVNVHEQGEGTEATEGDQADGLRAEDCGTEDPMGSEGEQNDGELCQHALSDQWAAHEVHMEAMEREADVKHEQPPQGPACTTAQRLDEAASPQLAAAQEELAAEDGANQLAEADDNSVDGPSANNAADLFDAPASGDSSTLPLIPEMRDSSTGEAIEAQPPSSPVVLMGSTPASRTSGQTSSALFLTPLSGPLANYGGTPLHDMDSHTPSSRWVTGLGAIPGGIYLNGLAFATPMSNTPGSTSGITPQPGVAVPSDTPDVPSAPASALSVGQGEVLDGQAQDRATLSWRSWLASSLGQEEEDADLRGVGEGMAAALREEDACRMGPAAADGAGEQGLSMLHGGSLQVAGPQLECSCPQEEEEVGACSPASLMQSTQAEQTAAGAEDSSIWEEDAVHINGKESEQGEEQEEAFEVAGMQETEQEEAFEVAGMQETEQEEAFEVAGMQETEQEEAFKVAGMQETEQEEAFEGAGMQETEQEEALEGEGMQEAEQEEAHEVAGVQEAAQEMQVMEEGMTEVEEVTGVKVGEMQADEGAREEEEEAYMAGEEVKEASAEALEMEMILVSSAALDQPAEAGAEAADEISGKAGNASTLPSPGFLDAQQLAPPASIACHSDGEAEEAEGKALSSVSDATEDDADQGCDREPSQAEEAEAGLLPESYEAEQLRGGSEAGEPLRAEQASIVLAVFDRADSTPEAAQSAAAQEAAVPASVSAVIGTQLQHAELQMSCGDCDDGEFAGYDVDDVGATSPPSVDTAVVAFAAPKHSPLEQGREQLSDSPRGFEPASPAPAAGSWPEPEVPVSSPSLGSMVGPAASTASLFKGVMTPESTYSYLGSAMVAAASVSWSLATPGGLAEDTGSSAEITSRGVGTARRGPETQLLIGQANDGHEAPMAGIVASHAPVLSLGAWRAAAEAAVQRCSVAGLPEGDWCEGDTDGDAQAAIQAVLASGEPTVLVQRAASGPGTEGCGESYGCATAAPPPLSSSGDDARAESDGEGETPAANSREGRVAQTSDAGGQGQEFCSPEDEGALRHDIVSHPISSPWTAAPSGTSLSFLGAAGSVVSFAVAAASNPQAGAGLFSTPVTPISRAMATGPVLQATEEDTSSPALFPGFSQAGPARAAASFGGPSVQAWPMAQSIGVQTTPGLGAPGMCTPQPEQRASMQQGQRHAVQHVALSPIWNVVDAKDQGTSADSPQGIQKVDTNVQAVDEDGIVELRRRAAALQIRITPYLKPARKRPPV